MDDAQILARVIDSTPVEIAGRVSALDFATIVSKTLEVVRS